MSTNPTILGDMIKQQTESDDTTSLDVERDLAEPARDGRAQQDDPARDMAIPPSDLPRGEGEDTAPDRQ